MASHRLCPWWLGYFLVGGWRRWIQDPADLLAPYVREGMTVLEPGPGMGFFTLELARRVGASGRVVVVDVQPKMLDRLKRRVEKAGLLSRVDIRLGRPETLGLAALAGQVDFTLAFAMVHEIPDAAQFFHEAAQVSKPGARLLFAEPRQRVTSVSYDAELNAAAGAGFVVTSQPAVRWSHAALLTKVF
jgi:ubiquinone/menaquinone biosynthesis C-methylase UbiE